MFQLSVIPKHSGLEQQQSVGFLICVQFGHDPRGDIIFAPQMSGGSTQLRLEDPFRRCSILRSDKLVLAFGWKLIWTVKSGTSDLFFVGSP